MKKLVKSRKDKKLCGVCGGIAKYLDTDSTIVRIITLILGVISFGATVVVYFGAALVMPFEEE